MKTEQKIKLLADTRIPKKQKTRASAVPDDAQTYTLKVNDKDGSLLKLLEGVKYLGDVGSSRSIMIEDMDEGKNKFSFDGDGADKIYDIQTD